jgi:prephenate dehydrogenase
LIRFGFQARKEGPKVSICSKGHIGIDGITRMDWNKVSLVGLGLLGGSLGKALITGNHARTVTGLVRRPERIQEAIGAGAVHEASLDIETVVKNADLVILCTPVLRMLPITKVMAGFLKPGAVVTDVGSVKGPLVRDLEPLLRKSQAVYVGSHPMAGSERQGLANADASLFSGATCVLTPGRESTTEAAQQVEQLWRQVEGIPVTMNPEEHDRLVARCSHLPHVLAALLAGWTLDPAHGEEQASLCSSGFRDTTRVASGSPEMWADILASNKEALLESLDTHLTQCKEIRMSIEQEQHEALFKWLSESKARRDAWLANYLMRRPSRSVE